jgi:RecB family exonuclease
MADERRNVAHVLSAHEARQWELPVMFVCGMTERQFPQFHRADPFFPEEARRRLNAAGIRVRTAEEFEREERALFDAAVAAATESAVLSYPESDARGERNLASVFLEGMGAAPEAALDAEARGRGESAELFEVGLAATAGAGPVGNRPQVGNLPHTISAPALLRALREKTARVSPTALETYLKCPFQYFAQRTLRLAKRPVRPELRLDFLLQGQIVHQTLADWLARKPEIAPLFDDIFANALEEHRIPPGYRVEQLRYAMLEDLREFAADTRWPYAAYRSGTEREFRFAVDAETWVRGKLDRLDTAPDGRAYVIDYKYSPAQSVKKKLKDPNLLQAPLYAMAAEAVFSARAAGMFYVGLKGGVTYAGWSNDPVGGVKGDEVPKDWLERARETTLRAVAEIRAGRIDPAPGDAESCGFCDFHDVCRRGAASALPAPEMAEGA